LQWFLPFLIFMYRLMVLLVRSNHPDFPIDEIQGLSPKAVGVMKSPVQKDSFSRSLIVLLVIYHHRSLRWLGKLLDSLELVLELVQFHLNFYNFPFA